jgi:hypothetical protein
VCNSYYKKSGLSLLQIPPRSPDLNPIEVFWSWVRRWLRSEDLEDLKKGRPALGKSGTKARVKQLLKTKRANQVAPNIFLSLKTNCRAVVENKGAAIRS